MKGIWDEEKHQKELNPISDETMSFLEIYANCEYMIRATNESKKAVLVFHYVKEDTWLYHYIDDNVIHEFAFMKEEEIPGTLREFYSFTFKDREMEYSFNLTDKQYDILSNPKKQKKLEKSFAGTSLEKIAFEKFLPELEINNHTMENISLFSIDKNRQLYLQNAAFFFNSASGVWLSEYEHDKDIPVKIYLANKEKWEEILDGVRNFSSDLIKEIAKLK